MNNTLSNITLGICSLIFIFLGAVCIHWGVTVKDTASGLSVVVGAFLIIYGLKFAYALWRVYKKL